VRTEGERRSRPIGLYPELKEPAWFRSRGLNPEESLLAEFARGGITARSAVYIQSFDAGSLKRLHELTPLPLIQLIDATSGVDPATIVRYARGVGVPKHVILGEAAFIGAARAAGLEIHGWTFRAENAYLLPDFRIGTAASGSGNLAGEIEAALDKGMVAFFADHPDVGRAVCDRRASSPVRR
jgi:glycerophosphoryl diester phosphodiesterase